MQILYFFIGWMVGIFVISFTLIQALIIIFFGIPTTITFNKSGRLKKNNGILKRYFISLLVLLFLFGLINLIVFSFSSALAWGYIFGGGMAMLLGLGKIGLNQDTMEDYVQSNKQYFDDSAPSVFSTLTDENEYSQEELERTIANMKTSDPEFSQKMAEATVEALKKATLGEKEGRNAK